jgi:hypothetical protein
MKLAIMQPYFFPYIGYFQLIAAVDIFIVYDNIKYTKKGWINRNRILQNGKDAIFTLPLKHDSDFLYICKRELAKDFNRDKLLCQFKGAYERAPYFSETFPLLERIVRYPEANLFLFLCNSIVGICEHLAIKTEIKVSSGIAIDHNLKNQDKVLALCKVAGATVYVNAIGGMELYSNDEFRNQGIDLKFIKSILFEYCQFDNAFVPWLSIIDVMMFNPFTVVQEKINSCFELI